MLYKSAFLFIKGEDEKPCTQYTPKVVSFEQDSF